MKICVLGMWGKSIIFSLKLYSNFVFYLANDCIFKIHRSISQGGFVGTKVL